MTAAKRYYSPKEVEAVYGIPHTTLANWRSSGKGPPYCKAGPKLVRYAQEDLDMWLAARRVRTAPVSEW